MPCFGAKLYLSAGIAFAAPTTWDSSKESKPSTAFAGSSFVPTGGDGGGPLICARICTPPLSITAPARIRARIRIVYPRSELFKERPQLTSPSLVAVREPSWPLAKHTNISFHLEQGNS